MPPKIYLQSPPHGDFRAMPALGDGAGDAEVDQLVPGQPGARPADRDGRRAAVRRGDLGAAGDHRRALGDGAAHRRGGGGRRAGAGARGRDDAPGSSAAGLHGAWAARCLAAAGYGAGVCHDPRAEAAERARRRARAGWRAGTREEALACDVVTLRDAGRRAGRRREATCSPGMHLNMLGADGPGKAEATIDAVVACELFCDEWAQASHGGELTGAVEARPRRRATDVTDLGAVLAGEAPRPLGRRRGDAVRLDRPGDPGPRDRGRRGLRRRARGGRVDGAAGRARRGAVTARRRARQPQRRRDARVAGRAHPDDRALVRSLRSSIARRLVRAEPSQRRAGRG